ncbi:hypothetical protein LTR28_004769 [Elasticomyces elasticus]|nr:hypothetical protein LTR28_004769 [Elasticomyces elasticus]
MRIRDLGYTPGTLSAGPTNSILDVPGVAVGQVTVPTDPSSPTASSAEDEPGPIAAHKGCTIVLPRPASCIHTPCHAGTHVFNGNGELTGTNQIADWGFNNTPICFTNSLSLGTCFDAVWDHMLAHHKRMRWDALTVARNYGTPVVGETADWAVNSELARSRLGGEDVRRAFGDCKTREEGGVVREGSFGGGAGMTCHQFAGGTGTASRLIPNGKTGVNGGEDYVLGALVQTNYGSTIDLQIGGVPIGKILQKEQAVELSEETEKERPADVHTSGTSKTDDGSILVLLITNAPLAPHQLSRLARHATVGLAQVGGHGIGRTFSGDIFLALSTAEHPPEQLSEGTKMQRINPTETYKVDVVKNEAVDLFFHAASEATEEAILNSLVGARKGMRGIKGGYVAEGLPVERVRELLRKYMVVV